MLSSHKSVGKKKITGNVHRLFRWWQGGISWERGRKVKRLYSSPSWMTLAWGGQESHRSEWRLPPGDKKNKKNSTEATAQKDEAASMETALGDSWSLLHALTSLNTLSVPTLPFFFFYFFFELSPQPIISLIATIWEASVAFLNSNFHRQKKQRQK